MKYLITFIILAALLVAPASALELSPPPVPESGAELMPERAETKQHRSFDGNIIYYNTNNVN